MKTCISCKHFGGTQAEPYLGGMAPQQNVAGPPCNHPDAATRDMIYGKAYCIAERNGTSGCGKQGKLWEPSSTQ